MSYSFFTKKISFVLISILLISSGCIRMPSRHDFGSYSNAEKFYAEGKYEKAIESYQKYREDHPDGNLAIIAQYYIAKSHAALGQKKEAEAGFQSIIQQYPELIWAQLSKEQLKNLSAVQ